MVDALRTFICSVDGTTVVRSRSGKWVHVEELDEKTPIHEADPVDATIFDDTLNPFLVLRTAAVEMLAHHATLHPASECEWHRSLLEAWKRT